MNNIKQRFTGNAIKVFEMSLEGKPLEVICAKTELTKHSVYTLKNRVKKALILEINNLSNTLES